MSDPRGSTAGAWELTLFHPSPTATDGSDGMSARVSNLQFGVALALRPKNINEGFTLNACEGPKHDLQAHCDTTPMGECLGNISMDHASPSFHQLLTRASWESLYCLQKQSPRSIHVSNSTSINIESPSRGSESKLGTTYDRCAQTSRKRYISLRC